MTVCVRATTGDEDARKGKRQDRRHCTRGSRPLGRFWISLLASSCEFQDSAGTCTNREQTGSGCDKHSMQSDFHTALALALSSQNCSTHVDCAIEFDSTANVGLIGALLESRKLRERLFPPFPSRPALGPPRAAAAAVVVKRKSSSSSAESNSAGLIYFIAPKRMCHDQHSVRDASCFQLGVCV